MVNASAKGVWGVEPHRGFESLRSASKIENPDLLSESGFFLVCAIHVDLIFWPLKKSSLFLRVAVSKNTQLEIYMFHLGALGVQNGNKRFVN